jgi:hypothetical protein
MSNETTNPFDPYDEAIQGTLLALQHLILETDAAVTTAIRYGMPFFFYKGKRFCYLWVHKKLNQPYIGFIHSQHLSHPKLLLEKRASIKIMLFNPEKDLPVRTIRQLVQASIDLYKNGMLPT